MINFEIPKRMLPELDDMVADEALWYMAISHATGQISGYLAELGKRDDKLSGDEALAYLCIEIHKALQVVDAKLTVLDAQVIHKNGFEPWGPA